MKRRRREETPLLGTAAVEVARDAAQFRARRVATGGQPPFQHGQAVGLGARRRDATRANLGRALLNLDLDVLYLDQERFALLLLRERKLKRRVATHLERASYGVAIHVEHDLERAWRDVWPAVPDVVRRDRQLHPRCFTSTSARTATAAPTAGTPTSTPATASTTTFLSATEPSRTRSCGRRRVPQVPHYTMDQAGRCRTRDFTDHLAVERAHDEPHFLRGPREMVGEDRAVGRVFRSVHPLRGVGDVFPVQHQRGARHRKEMRLRRGDRVGPVGDGRSVIEDPDAAPVRAKYEVLRARLYENVVVAGGREVGRETRPVRTAVIAHEEKALRASEDDARPPGELANAPHRPIARKPIRDRLPCLSEISRAHDVRREVADTVRVERDVRGATRRFGSDHAAHERAIRHARNRAARLPPRRSCIQRELDVSIVRAHPENLRVHGRLGDRRDLAEAGLPVVPGELDVLVHHAHQKERVAVDGAREVLRPRPGDAEILRDEETIGSDEDGARLVYRGDDGRVPVPAVRWLASRRLRLDVEPVARLRVEPLNVAAVGGRVDEPVTCLVHRLPRAVTEADLLPVLVQDAEPMAGGAGPHPRVRVLQAAVDPVGIAVVGGDLVELADRDVVEAHVREPEVPALVHSTVAADKGVARVARIDPHRVVVGLQAHVVRRRVRHVLERRTAVLALEDRDAEFPDTLVVGGIDVGCAEVHRARIRTAHPPPGRAGVFTAIRAALGRVLDERDEHVRVGARDGESDAPLVAGGDAVLDLLPCGAAVGGLEDRAPRSATVEAPRAAQPLIRRGVEDVRVAGIHGEVRRAGKRVDVQNLRPRAPAVGGLKDAALGVRLPQVSDRRDVCDVRIGGVQHHAADVATLGESHVGPGRAAVRGPIDAAAP